MVSSRIIGWRFLKGMRKQHLVFYTYDGDAMIHCMGTTPNLIATLGWSVNKIEKSDLLINDQLPKCKKCLREEERIKRIGEAQKQKH